MGKTLAKKKDEQSLAFGGQALIEGVMMRSRRHMVMCVRKSRNEILTNVEEIHSLCDRYKVLGLPFLRGIVALFETLYLGFKALFFSANAVAEEEGVKFTYKELVVVAVLALGLLSFFFVVPFLLTSLLNLTGVLFNIAEAIIRLAIFILYLVLVGTWGEFRRVLQYHGAEHKTINAYEAGAPLDVASVKNYSRLHPRCGTSFLFITVIVSIVLFSVMPDWGFAVRLSYRLLLIPVIGGVSYELLRLSGRYRDSIVMRIVTLPGLAFQRLTTREPSDDMIEVAIKAAEETIKLKDSLKE
ncbi:MAG: DUF1385 domain-containing protein [Candidatus Bathyarchaeota archaeon]|nr:DUF1385 domain-containing protein [Candidatus Bathyarchaeota archaeon]